MEISEQFLTYSTKTLAFSFLWIQCRRYIGNGPSSEKSATAEVHYRKRFE